MSGRWRLWSGHFLEMLENEMERCRLCHRWIANGAWALEQHKAHCNKTQRFPCPFCGKKLANKRSSAGCYGWVPCLRVTCHGWVPLVDVRGLLLGAVVVRYSCRVPGAVAGCHGGRKVKLGKKNEKLGKSLEKFCAQFLWCQCCFCFFTFCPLSLCEDQI